uniref:Uncharacterized protein n=1 Tax=Agrobacterium tumefaciens TaxID=358 RepID=A0A3S6I7D7_AGRTU|nr:hypothetical protein AgrTiEU6_70 [Agrobacterium tumefaciens]
MGPDVESADFRALFSRSGYEMMASKTSPVAIQGQSFNA